MKTKKRLLGILLSLALVLGLMPGMSFTAMADTPNETGLNENFTNGIPGTWTSSTDSYHFEAKEGYVWADPNNGDLSNYAFLYSPALDLSNASSATLVLKYILCQPY